ncbi:MAG TPA: DinB family protein [Thermomicrobiales bacterium]|nr:DinB family protein [Thermomicrobiales bacterium]
MGPGLQDLARHNAWATAQVLRYCQGLDDVTLNATVPGTYGTIIETLRHIVASEASYIYRLAAYQPGLLWREDRAVGLDVLAERAVALGSALEQFLATDWDDERLGEARGDEGEVFAVPAAIFLTQAIHHANEHRAHICTILGALGLETPEVSAWDYAIATGRMTLKTPTSAS